MQSVSQSVRQSVSPPARVVKIRLCHVYEYEYEYEYVYGSIGMNDSVLDFDSD